MLLSWLLLCRLAHAGVDITTLKETLTEVHAATDGSVLVSFDAPPPPVLTEWLATLQPSPAVLVHGEQPITPLTAQQLLQTHPQRCLLTLSADHEQQWQLLPYGSCSPPAASETAVVDHPMPTAEPTDAFPFAALHQRLDILSHDNHSTVAVLVDDASQLSTIAESMPANLQPTARLVVLETGDAIEEVLQQHAALCGLHVTAGGTDWQIQTVGDCSPRPPHAQFELEVPQTGLEPFWIRDPSGHRLTTSEYASHIGDEAMLGRLERETRTGQRMQLGLRIAGAALSVGAVLPLTRLPDNAAGAEDRIWTSTFLLTTGLTAVFLAPQATASVQDRHQVLHSYYTIEEVQGHNTLVEPVQDTSLPAQESTPPTSVAAPATDAPSPETAAEEGP